MLYLEKIWKTKGRLATIKAYMSSIDSPMSRATEAVDRMAAKLGWGEAAKVETVRYERIGV